MTSLLQKSCWFEYFSTFIDLYVNSKSIKSWFNVYTDFLKSIYFQGLWFVTYFIQSRKSFDLADGCVNH